MATRNERKAKARKARSERRRIEQAADNSKLVQETVRLNRLNGVPRNYWPESPMGSLKSMGTSGRVGGLSRLPPVPDANGDWTKQVDVAPIDWQAVRAKRKAWLNRFKVSVA